MAWVRLAANGTASMLALLGDCTADESHGTDVEVYGNMLTCCVQPNVANALDKIS